ncbi:MAG: hypothetical protein HUK22_03895, partial [Thermoguttaceae bacterium]|nr:hypothetical protein [Thermoguttaceae bacterium]
MKKSFWILSAVFCVSASALLGCGPRNTFGVVDVQGKITVDGRPVEGIVVTMAPADPAANPTQRAAAG